MNIWIYSSNMFFIQGVSALVAEAFGKKKCAIHVFDEKQIMDIMPASDGMSRIFVFSDTKNPLRKPAPQKSKLPRSAMS